MRFFDFQASLTHHYTQEL